MATKRTPKRTVIKKQETSRPSTLADAPDKVKKNLELERERVTTFPLPGTPGGKA